MEEHLKAQLDAHFASKKIDWEQRRYELAKAAMQGIMASHNQSAVAYRAIQIADEMIKQLKDD